jgi:CRISPR-associated protein Cas2
MSKGFSDYAIVYDISINRERSKVDKILKGFGFRIQKSVFECRLNRKTKNELIEKLNDLEIKSGFVKIYRLEYSWKDCTIGQKKTDSQEEKSAFIV